MPKETFPRQEKSENRESREYALEQLLPLLKQEAMRLRERGFPVTNDCRIDTSAFKDIYASEDLEKDARYVKSREASFEEAVGAGELLEVVKTLAFNERWFKGRVVAVRTSKYDDYKNGIDEIIFDLETKQPLAVVDTTTNWKEKVSNPDFMEHIKHGGTIKYGVGMERGEVEKKSYTKLPIFVVSLRQEEIERLAGEIAEGGTSKASSVLERSIVDHLLQQSEALGHLTGVPEAIRSQYSADHDIFERLAA